MKVRHLIDEIYLIEDVLDLENYPNLIGDILEESKIISGNRGGRKMCRMTAPGMKYTINRKPYSKKNYTKTVAQVREEIEKKIKFKNFYFNTCTLNYYKSGSCGFRLHSDYMIDLEEPMIIGTLTLGNSNRVMQLQHIQTGKVLNIELKHNSLLMMGPMMQRRWHHGIPKDSKNKIPRLSLSFRRQKV